MARHGNSSERLPIAELEKVIDVASHLLQIRRREDAVFEDASRLHSTPPILREVRVALTIGAVRPRMDILAVPQARCFVSVPSVSLHSDSFRVGASFGLTLQRTVRLPIDGRTYPLPPGFGALPVLVQDGRFMVPMHDREALWLSFHGQDWRPVAVKVGVGGVNAITGEPFDLELRAGRQDYTVVPDQPWLDGIKVDDELIRQFVAVPLGEGETVEGRVTGKEAKGGLQLAVFQPVPGRFPERPPRGYRLTEDTVSYCVAERPMGIGAGGRMRQKIYSDTYGIRSWDAASVVAFEIQLVHATDWPRLTGHPAPPSPIDAQAYIKLELPWFDLADQAKTEVATSPVLANVSPVSIQWELPVTVLHH
jgi:hypothetical protein